MLIQVLITAEKMLPKDAEKGLERSRNTSRTMLTLEDLGQRWLAEPRNLLSHQQVNKTWHGVIKMCPTLQRKLHYKVDPLKDRHGNSYTWNALIGHLSPRHDLSRNEEI